MFLRRTRHAIDMVDGPLLSNVAGYATPLILTGMLQLLYNMADIVVVGRFESPDAVAAVGATSALINLMINVFMGLSVGTSVVVAQAVGAGSHRDIRGTVHTSIALSMIMGVAIGVFGLLASRALLVVMNTPEGAVLNGAALYMRIYFLGMPGNMVYNFGAAVLRAVGDTKKPLYYLSLAGLVNVCLNLVFVIVFKMGVAGVAIATIASQYISAALVLINLMRSHGSIQLRLRELRVEKDRALQIVRVGLPAGLQGTIFSLSNVIVQSSVNAFGPVVVAGNTASQSIESFVYTSMNAIYQTALAFTSQNVGARRPERLSPILRTCAGATTAVGIAFGAIAIVFSRPLLHLFINPEYMLSAPEVIADVIHYGQLRIQIICSAYFVCGLMEVMVGMLRGMGNSVTPMFVSIVGVCVMRILWVYTVFAADRRLEVLYISYPISWFATGAVHYLFYRRTRRRLMGTLSAAEVSAGP